MRRIAQVVGLKPEHREAYLALHAEPWPEVLAALKRAHIQHYSIFLHANLLFAYFEYTGHDWDADQRQIMADPATQRWLAQTDPCQHPLETARPNERWANMEQVFWLE